MHAIVAARLGDTELALRYFHETAATDLSDNGGASAGGVRIAALGGLWLAALFGLAGLSLRADAVALDPRLPPSWRSLGFRVHWRGRLVKVHIEPGSSLLAATLEAGEPMALVVSEQRHALRPGETLRLPIGTRSG
jgi:trehalose/maltose hydrolase-like predicted phosphorylase